MSWATLCELHELAEKEGRYVEIDGFHLAVFLDGGVPHAIDDRCPHAGASLSAGIVMNGCALCPRHEWAFQLSDEKLLGAPQIAVSHYVTRIFDFGGKRFVQADLPTP